MSRSSFGGGSLVGSFKSAFSRGLVTKAGGAVAASFVTGYVLNRWGASLPMATNKWGRVGYSVGIPILGAYLVRRKSRDLAEGMVIGGLVMGINALVSQVRASTASAPASVGSYGAYPRVAGLGVAGELGYGFYPNRPGNVGAVVNTSPFSNSAW